MSIPDLPFACQCGTVSGRLTAASPKTGIHIDCACKDCRDAYTWLGYPPAGPLGFFQTTPDLVEIETGADKLSVFTWRSTRLLRWYATCCKAPLFHTGPSPKMHFVSLALDRVVDTSQLGPVRAHGFIDKGNGQQGHSGMGHVVLGLVTRSLPAVFNGKWKDTPFFDPQTGKTIAPVRHLKKSDRAKPLSAG